MPLVLSLGGNAKNPKPWILALALQNSKNNFRHKSQPLCASGSPSVKWGASPLRWPWRWFSISQRPWDVSATPLACLPEGNQPSSNFWTGLDQWQNVNLNTLEMAPRPFSVVDQLETISERTSPSMGTISPDTFPLIIPISSPSRRAKEESSKGSLDQANPNSYLVCQGSPSW